MSTATQTDRHVTFFVPGIPKPAGSKKGFVHRHTGRVIITDDCAKGKDWRASVAQVASEAVGGALLEGPLFLQVLFVFPRPKGHYGTGRQAGVIKLAAPDWPAVKPDTTKLVRCLEDALSGVAFKDDVQIIGQHAVKTYGRRPGAHVVIRSMEPAGSTLYPPHYLSETH